MERAALYIRVSTEEQAMRGYSLEAQREALTRYAKEHEMLIVDYYQDEGKSARKPYKTRPECMRMLSDVEAGKIDVILFIKLDRWFRNVGEYYKVQEILERHKVVWRAILEDYETATSSGQFKVNIMLSVAQNEADRTSERIKFVFDAKVKRGEAITGRLPMGLKIENKHVVHDPEKADMVRDLFQHYAEHGSKRAVIQYAYDTYGIMLEWKNLCNMLSNPLYKGVFRDNQAYCEPLIEPALFDRLNAADAAPNIKIPPSRRVYIFSGLVICAECGYHMTANYMNSAPHKRPDHLCYYYRCNRYTNYKSCSNKKRINEKNLEKWLLENVEEEIRRYLLETNKTLKTAKRSKAAAEKAELKRRLLRLKDLYIIESIDLETYKADYERYTARLKELEEEEAAENAGVPSAEKARALEEFIASNFKVGYDDLDREARRSLWRGVIKEVRVDAAQNLSVIF